MNSFSFSRRDFIHTAIVVSTVSSMQEVSAEVSPPSVVPIRLGGPIFQISDDPEELALAHKKQRYSAAYCPDVSIDDTDRIHAIADAFKKHDVVIAEVGRWCNLMDADPEKRKHNINWVTEGLALAEAIGARCCVNIAGSFNQDVWYGPHPKNLSEEFFDAAVENARTIIDAVRPKRAKFTYEMMGWCLPDSPDAYLKLLRAVDREGFAVHLDPCNLVNSPERFYKNGALIQECFDKIGPYIVSCHAKDLTWEIDMSVHFREVAPGKGSLDLSNYLRRLAGLPHQPPLMLEHLTTAEEYGQARDYLLSLGEALALGFA